MRECDENNSEGILLLGFDVNVPDGSCTAAKKAVFVSVSVTNSHPLFSYEFIKITGREQARI